MAKAIDSLNLRVDRIKSLTIQYLKAAESKSPEASRLADELTRELEATKSVVRGNPSAP